MQICDLKTFQVQPDNVYFLTIAIELYNQSVDLNLNIKGVFKCTNYIYKFNIFEYKRITGETDILCM